MGSLLPNAVSLAAIDMRIDVIRDNIRNLVEQATAYSVAADENRIADRISGQEDLLAKMLKERASLDECKRT